MARRRTVRQHAELRLRHPGAARLGLMTLALVALTHAAGCAAGGSWFGSSARATSQSATIADTSGGSAIGDYLELMQTLAEGDAFTRADAFRAAEDAADFAPTTANRMRYALALAVPGHPGSDPGAAASRLRELVAAGDALLPEERMLATVQLSYVEQLVVLEGNGRALQQRLEEAVAERDAVAAERIRNLQSENARLRTELQDTTSMLEAITNIEESISERGNQ